MPFVQFFEEQVVRDPEFSNTDCFGISIVYDHQMVHALWLARELKRRWPEKLLLLGGTSISQYYKHMRDKSHMKRFFSVCDAIVVGEGETAICEIADSGGDLYKKPILANTITYDGVRDQLHLPAQIHYENVSSLGSPVYDFPWDLYLSPERGINYAPTRGCYWNRCTFCDYGLNTDKPTSPWRERNVAQVVSDVKDVTEKEKVRYVYFAVDVMAPGYMERLSDAMLDSGVDIRWSAELRMEKIFLPERCRKLAKAGCVCVSFGMESGNQRVLDLIDKGTKVQYMGQTMKNFAEAGIAVQLMAFKGFPTETEAEKKDTLKFVSDNNEYWATGGLGTFLLTGNAIVAKQPEKFGIKILQTESADVSRAVAYQMDSQLNSPALSTEDYDASFDDDGGIFPHVLGRPWAGGTDTLHSMIYYEQYGRSFFREQAFASLGLNSKVSEESIAESTLRISARISQAPFDVGAMIANRKKHKQHTDELLKKPAEPTYSDLMEWHKSVPAVSRAFDSKTYWISTDQRCMKLDESTFRLIQKAANVNRMLSEVLDDVDADTKMRFMISVKRLAAAGLVQLYHGADSLKPAAKFVPQSSGVREGEAECVGAGSNHYQRVL